MVTNLKQTQVTEDFMSESLNKEELIRKGKEMCKKCELEDDGHIYEYCGQCKLNEFLDLIESEST